MNKAEKAELEGLRQDLRMVKALKFTDVVYPDIPIPTLCDDVAKGFTFTSYVSMHPQVKIACSSSRSHSTCRDNNPNTQGGIELYSSRLLALKALRNSFERQFAGELARIDQEIQDELKVSRTEVCRN